MMVYMLCVWTILLFIHCSLALVLVHWFIANTLHIRYVISIAVRHGLRGGQRCTQEKHCQ